MVYLEELATYDRTIRAAPTSITAFVGRTANGPLNTLLSVRSYSEFKAEFGDLGELNTLAYTVEEFFANGGSKALIVRICRDWSYQAAFDSLRNSGNFNLLCLPPDNVAEDVDLAVVRSAMQLCLECRALLIIDPPCSWSTAIDVLDADKGVAALGLSGLKSASNAAIFFPRITRADSGLCGIGSFVPCGAVAGVIARTDTQRGVWKAAAGPSAALKNIQGLSVPLTDDENGQLSQEGVNCLRNFRDSGPVVWGARTLEGMDKQASDWKCIPVRRLALFIEESLYRGIRWVVFEPNDKPLWAKIRLAVDTFMQRLFSQGAFQGRDPKDAYFVKCDAETTTQIDRNLGIVNILVGFAPQKAAEFVIVKVQQIAGNNETEED